jgi:tRNA(His) 5'-end guanylyltransferase
MKSPRFSLLASMVGPLQETEEEMQDDLGNRMKEYEEVVDYPLTRRLPLIVRVDGKAFHTLTRDLERPFDSKFLHVMQRTAQDMCSKSQNCRLAYTQSDEISLLFVDYGTIYTDAWLKNRLQKIVSISASLATHYFRFNYTIEFGYHSATIPALFDARVFTLPPHEVQNYFIWRQQDCTRNSISALAQVHFGHKELQGKSGKQMQGMLLLEKGVNWNDLPIEHKRGVSILYKNQAWSIDREPPIFTQDRGYIDRHVYTEVTGCPHSGPRGKEIW